MALINIDDVSDLLFWTARFNCTSHELRLAVRTVGAKAADVGEYLRQRRSLTE